MVTIGKSGERWVWHHKRPGMTWTSNESFATLTDAVCVGRDIARCKGERFVEPVLEIEPEVEIYADDAPEGYGLILDTPEPPAYYTERVDKEMTALFLGSLIAAGVIVAFPPTE